MPKGNGTKTAHQRALPFAKVGEALAKVRASQAWPATKLAFEFLVLTAARSGEIRGAKWKEIDTGGRYVDRAGLDRTKTGAEHRVPLSPGAVAVLEAAREVELADDSGLVFPSPSWQGA